MATRFYQAGPKRRQEIGRRWVAAPGRGITGYPKGKSVSKPPYEKLIGDLADAYSRRINVQRRLVYQVLEEDHVVKVIRMWTHYE